MVLLELRWKMMGASAFFIPVLSTMFELWESLLGFVQIVDLSLLSSRPRGRNFSWRRASPPARGSVFPFRVDDCSLSRLGRGFSFGFPRWIRFCELSGGR